MSCEATDDDFFYEEDKIAKKREDFETPLLPLLDEDVPHIVVAQELGVQPNEVLPKEQPTSTDIDAVVVGVNPRFCDNDRQKFELERLGMLVTTNTVIIRKDQSNLIGISIGGGAPMCPCLYIVQVFDNTPAALEGSLQSGDELLAVNSTSVKGKTKVEVAKMIQATTDDVTIHYNKLHADPEQGKSLDIILKKLKHRIVDSMSSNTADTLGLSRAILCNDSLVKRLEELEGTEIMYKGLVDHARRMLKAYYDLLQSYKSFGDIFSQISAREPQQRASEAFRTFGEFHRNLEKDGLHIIKQIKPVLSDFGTYLNKAIPDTKMTVRRYADAKFTYLSYCLKVKEMDDEEHGFAAIQEPLYRVETGNYEYRLILRCRQDARAKFAKLRTDVLEKMELLENKHATDLNRQLKGLVDSLAELNSSVVERIDSLPPLFPIEVDFKETDFLYNSSTLTPQELDDEEAKRVNADGSVNQSLEVACGAEAVEQPARVINAPTATKPSQEVCLLDDIGGDETKTNGSSEELLKELGLFGIDLSLNPITMNQHNSASATTAAGAQDPTYDFDLFLNQTATTTELERDLMLANAMETDLLLN